MEKNSEINFHEVSEEAQKMANDCGRTMKSNSADTKAEIRQDIKNEKIIVIDFGGQYNQLIARRVRECGVYCEVHPFTISLDKLADMNPKGVILTGGPNSVYDESSPHCSTELFNMGIPVLGICYGAQLMAYTLGGKIVQAPTSEYGRTSVKFDNGSMLFDGMSKESIMWMSHTDMISTAPNGFDTIASTSDCPIAAMANDELKLYAVQFHPEVTHSVEGYSVISNFVNDICDCQNHWHMDSFVEGAIDEIRNKVGSGKALCALSGGVDSSVAAVLMSKAIGNQLTCVFVDHGLMRKNEASEVEAIFGESGHYDLNFIHVDASKRFYDRLKGITDPEQKRKVIGEEFIRVFEEEAKKIGSVDYLVQGTIYPDVIESGLGSSAVIKSHHNVGGLPDCVDFKDIIEPLRMLFKDEVRRAGLELGLPRELVFRQPFPGPGLGVRIIGEITPEKVEIVQEADAIFRETILEEALKLNDEVSDSDKGTDINNPFGLNQYFAALSNMKSVGVKGDFRTYDYAVVLRGVTTEDFMTAEATQIPWHVLSKATSRIVNEVERVNRVFYDLTAKPPGTVEFE